MNGKRGEEQKRFSSIIGKEFIEKTRAYSGREYTEGSDQRKGLPKPPHEIEYSVTQNVVDLSKPRDISVDNIFLRDAIEKRRSIREYSEQYLTLEEISWLLWSSQGVKNVTDRPSSLRTVPSGGSCHPFETYLLVNRIKGLKPGLYRFLAFKHKLLEINLEDGLADKVTKAIRGTKFVATSAVTFIWIAVAYRKTWRYGERGYRSILLDAGHICQNLYLSAEAIECGVCAIGAFNDDDINNLLGINGVDQFVTYIATVGKKR